MTDAERDQVIADTIAALGPIVRAAVRTGIEEAIRRITVPQMQDGVIIGIDGRTAEVQPLGHGEEDSVHVTRLWSTQVVDDIVSILYMPNGAGYALGRLPAPTISEE